MNDGFKQRLVGAIVLTCVALIFWPILFSDGAGPVMDKRSQIPPMPEFEKFDVPEPARPDRIIPVAKQKVEQDEPVDLAPLDSASVDPLPKPAEPAPAPAPAQPAQPAQPAVTAKPAAVVKPSLDAQGLPEGWVLQVASFSQAKNADELKADLQKQGYKAYTRKVATKNGEVVRVYIGPKLSKQAFDKDRPIIDKKYKVKSIVVQFEQ